MLVILPCWAIGMLLCDHSCCNSARKVTLFFRDMQEKSHFGAFFVWRIGNYFRNLVNFFRGQYSNTSYIWWSYLPCTALSNNTKTNAISLKKWRIVGRYQKRELLQTLQHTFHDHLNTRYTVSGFRDDDRAF